MAGVRLVSINIERSKHLDLVLPFLQAENPDVICIQELLERDIPRFEAALGGTMIYEPVGMHPLDPPETGDSPEGIGILCRMPLIGHEVRYYAGSETAAHHDNPSRKPKNRPVMFARVEKGGSRYDIGTTHFTWTPDGRPTDAQREDLARLLELLSQEPSFVLSGDFNAPRGGDVFTAIAAHYTDNVPPEYAWSLDLNKHRAGGGKIEADAAAYGLPGFMVDGLFSTPDYRCEDVRLESGVSDHCAIIATIEKLS